MQIKKLFFLLLLFATYIHASFLYSNEKLNSREKTITAELLSPGNQAVIKLLTPEQEQFFADPMRKVPHKLELTPRKKDLSIPEPVVFRWKSLSSVSTLQISRKKDFSILDYNIAAKGKNQIFHVSIYQLHCGTTYYWRVKTDRDFSPVQTFTTDVRLPRMIYLPGVTNVRDMGGWQSCYGGKSRYGMVYRGGGMDKITEEGRRIFLKDLKIRTELDLRKRGTNIFSKDDVVYYKFVNSAYATWKREGIFTPDQLANMKEIFGLLAKKETYPVYIHCAGGGDRTGTLAYLLGMVLGMEEQDLLDDYEISNLSISGERHRYSQVWIKFMERLDTYKGATRRERVESYLYSCGITKENLEQIRKILLEK